jgi:hypothetical protein
MDAASLPRDHASVERLIARAIFTSRWLLAPG